MQQQTPNESLFELYFRYAKDTEPPTIYHRWSLISSVGALLGRQYWFPFGTTRIFPNQYVMLIGNPGTRKSTAIKMARRVIAGTGYSTFAAERTSKEKFLLDLEGVTDEDAWSKSGSSRGKRTTTASDVLDNLDLGGGGEIHDGIPKEIFVTADEFNEFSGTGNIEFLSMLGALWDWDDEDTTYKHRFKNSKSISIFQPTISILGGNTHSSFKLAFPEQAIGQGFLSRLILVYSEPSGRKITFPTKPSDVVVSSLSTALNGIKECVRGEATMAPTAERALDTIYRTSKDLEDYRFKSYSTRRFTHLIKLCLITTAMRGVTQIEVDDVILANTILTYTESNMSKALGEFGRSKDSEAQHNIMTALYESKTPLSISDLWKIVSRDVDKQERLADILSSLASAGKIQAAPGVKGMFLPMQKPMAKENTPYVNLNLLKEVTGK